MIAILGNTRKPVSVVPGTIDHLIISCRWNTNVAASGMSGGYSLVTWALDHIRSISLQGGQGAPVS